jgi:hypothetical protein
MARGGVPVNDSRSVLGCVLVSVLCAWAVWFSIKEIRNRLDSGTAVDRTLGEVDNPRLLHLQVLGFVLLAAASALILVMAVVTAVGALRW